MSPSLLASCASTSCVAWYCATSSTIKLIQFALCPCTVARFVPLFHACLKTDFSTNICPNKRTCELFLLALHFETALDFSDGLLFGNFKLTDFALVSSYFVQTSAPTAAPVASQTFGLGCPEGKVFDDVLGCVGESHTRLRDTQLSTLHCTVCPCKRCSYHLTNSHMSFVVRVSAIMLL
jgi:hypothetical protein